MQSLPKDVIQLVAIQTGDARSIGALGFACKRFSQALLGCESEPMWKSLCEALGEDKTEDTLTWKATYLRAFVFPMDSFVALETMEGKRGLLARMWSKLRGKRESARFAVVGAPCAGKSTIIWKLLTGERFNGRPDGALADKWRNGATIRYRNLRCHMVEGPLNSLRVRDLGSVDGVILVVDVCCKMAQPAEFVKKFASYFSEHPNFLFLIFCNKVDEQGAAKVAGNILFSCSFDSM